MAGEGGGMGGWLSLISNFIGAQKKPIETQNSDQMVNANLSQIANQRMEGGTTPPSTPSAVAGDYGNYGGYGKTLGTPPETVGGYTPQGEGGINKENTENLLAIANAFRGQQKKPISGIPSVNVSPPLQPQPKAQPVNLQDYATRKKIGIGGY